MNRFKLVKKASFLGIASNFFLLVIKTIVGLLTKSQAMIADAVNSFGDVFSSVMTLIGNKIASKPRDDDHNLGHGKAEYIYSMLISVVIMLISLILLKDSVLSFFSKNEFKFSLYLIIVCIITIVVKFSLYIYTIRLSKRVNNLLLKANAKDHLSDAIITSTNLISVILSYYNIYILDSILGVVISVFIFITGIKIYKESYDVLMDKSISNETKGRVLEIIKKYDEIKKINHFNATPVGYKYQISFTIFVDGNMSTYLSHEVANKIEKELSSLDEIYLTVIHVNPI